MNNTLKIILYSSAAGLPIIIGGLLSSIVQSRKSKLKLEINHWLIAFGGGALLAAVAFALIPRGVSELTTIELVISILLGTFSFMLLDMFVSQRGGSLAQVISMMMDFLPEALALGASFAYDQTFGFVLALFIGLQNLPEGYNSYIELSKKMGRTHSLLLMLGLSFTGIFAALAGEFFLKDSPKIVAMIMVFAGSGIIYLIFQDIAPLSRRKKDWIPATGASIGFLIGLLGEKLI